MTSFNALSSIDLEGLREGIKISAKIMVPPNQV
jgi:hypothetical protein